MNIYLAIPFSYHPNPDFRIKEIGVILQRLQLRYPEIVFLSAIFYYPLVADTHKDNLGYWYSLSEKLINMSREVWVYNPRNIKSAGVDLELRVAYRKAVPIKVIDHENY